MSASKNSTYLYITYILHITYIYGGNSKKLNKPLFTSSLFPSSLRLESKKEFPSNFLIEVDGNPTTTLESRPLCHTDRHHSDESTINFL